MKKYSIKFLFTTFGKLLNIKKICISLYFFIFFACVENNIDKKIDDKANIQNKKTIILDSKKVSNVICCALSLFCFLQYFQIFYPNEKTKPVIMKSNYEYENIPNIYDFRLEPYKYESNKHNYYEIKGKNTNPLSLLIFKNQTYSPWFKFYKNTNTNKFASDQQNIEFEYTVMTSFLLNSTSLNNVDPKKDFHTEEGYLTWINNFWYFNVPQVIFLGCDINENHGEDCKKIDKIYNTVINIRSKILYPTIIYKLTSFEMEIGHLFRNVPPEETDPIKIRRYFANKVWSMKIFYMKRLVINNPFNSKYFIYMDTGIFRKNPRKEILFIPNMTLKYDNYHNDIWPYKQRLKLLDNDKAWFMDWTYIYEFVRTPKYNVFENITMSNILKDIETPIYNESKTNLYQRNHCKRYYNSNRKSIDRLSIAGGYIAGTKKAILSLCAAYEETLYQRYWKKGPLNLAEQIYFGYTVCDNPDLVSLIRGRRPDNQERTASFLKFFLNPDYSPFNYSKWIIY